eukprot:1961311-Pyramimonas_sp.AAC.1
MGRRWAPDSESARSWAGWAIGPIPAMSGRWAVDAPPPEPIPPSTLHLTYTPLPSSARFFFALTASMQIGQICTHMRLKAPQRPPWKSRSFPTAGNCTTTVVMLSLATGVVTTSRKTMGACPN